MSSLLIAVGGTGQHVALAACRLMRLGALPRLRVVVVDSDIRPENGLTENLQTFWGTVKPPYTEHPADGAVKVCPPLDLTTHSDPQFEALFLSGNEKERAIFEVLFDKESASVKVKEGFYAKPTIGATVFLKFQGKHMMPVVDAARVSGSSDSVFVVGSLTGGTGAGLLHSIIRWISSEAPAPRKYGVFYQPWFRKAATTVNQPLPPASANGGGKGQTVTEGTLDRNWRFGVDYLFSETARLLDGSLILGIPDKPVHEKLSKPEIGEGRVGEVLSPLHTLAAYSVLKWRHISSVEQTQGSIYVAALSDPAQLYDEMWSAEKTLSWYYNRGTWLRDLLKFVAGEKFGNELRSVFKKAFALFAASPDRIGSGLYEVIKRFPDTSRDVMIGEMQKVWELLAKQYESCLQWLDSTLGPLPGRLLAEKVRGFDPVTEIQRCWKQSPIHVQANLPSAAEVARVFHNLLVEGFL